MFFYLLFPLLLFIQKKSIWIFAGIIIVLFALSQYFHLRYYPQRSQLPDSIVDTVFFSPIIHLSQFLLGMTGGYLFARFKDALPKLRWLPLVLFAVIILLIAYRPANISYQVGLIAPVFLLLILSIAINDTRTLNFRPLVYLGEISYGIYILQWPFYIIADTMNQRHVHVPKQYFFWCALGLLIAIASASYHFFELPLRKRISGARSNEKTRVSNQAA